MSNLPNYDELVTVRLELNRVRDQRDALQAGLTKEIRELIRAELSAQLDAVSCQLVERDDLRKENARLVEQVERLKVELEKKWHWASRSEIELRNKAEDENARLRAEVERLRKAGDAMVDYIERTESSAYYIEPDGGDRIAEWLAAKEGNPSK